MSELIKLVTTHYDVVVAGICVCRDDNWFYAEVDTPPGEHIDFVLTYEQLLRRRLGVYQLSLPLGHRFPFILLTFSSLLFYFSEITTLTVLQFSVFVSLNYFFTL